jgi:hypothetical protein
MRKNPVIFNALKIWKDIYLYEDEVNGITNFSLLNILNRILTVLDKQIP